MARLAQLRTYTINKGEMEEFVAVWRDQVVPLRRHFGFIVDGGWVYAEANKFVWMVSLDGTPDEWEAKTKAYIESPERQNMKPNPADFIAHMDITMIQSVFGE
ncbi:MAG: NIPSNAP family containing protein [Anaerolineae bacterium]|nr:MAG: NIPSNAP family containing protein [Anaerolineae bacterium]